MKFCANCGAQMNDEVKFCPVCGAQAAAPANQQAQQNNKQTSAGSDIKDKLAQLNNTADASGSYSEDDIAQNKSMGVIAYCSWLVLVPMFAAPKSGYARFHANQGLTLAISETVYLILRAILNAILCAIFPYKWGDSIFSYSRGPIYGFLSAVLWIVGVVFVILAIIGIMNALNGKAKELPVIGKFRLLK